MELNVHFDYRDDMFSTDKAKLAFAFSFLKEAAATWLEAIREEADKTGDPAFEGRYSKFKEKFLTTFGKKDRKNAAVRGLEGLVQAGSAAQYVARFNQLAVLVDWNQAAKVHQFKKGLKDKIKDILAETPTPPPTTLNELQDYVIRIDTRLYERSQDRRGITPSFQQTRPNPFMNRTERPRRDPNAMEVDLTRTEQDHRRKNGLCYNCGAKGHLSKDCPKRKGVRYPNRIAEAQEEEPTIAISELAKLLKMDSPKPERKALPPIPENQQGF
jgi:hypothetical protein